MLTLTFRIRHDHKNPDAHVEVHGRVDATLDSDGNHIHACPHEVILAKMLLTWIECQQAGDTIIVLPEAHTDAVEEFIRTKFPESAMSNETQFAQKVMNRIKEVVEQVESGKKEEAIIENPEVPLPKNKLH